MKKWVSLDDFDTEAKTHVSFAHVFPNITGSCVVLSRSEFCTPITQGILSTNGKEVKHYENRMK